MEWSGVGAQLSLHISRMMIQLCMQSNTLDKWSPESIIVSRNIMGWSGPGGPPSNHQSDLSWYNGWLISLKLVVGSQNTTDLRIFTLWLTVVTRAQHACYVGYIRFHYFVFISLVFSQNPHNIIYIYTSWRIRSDISVWYSRLISMFSCHL